jgi:hypothetical protein
MAPRGDYPSSKQDQYMARLPDGMRDALKAAADANNRSMNAEIVARLEAGGETLRDHFAMAAMQGMLSGSERPEQYMIPQRSSYDFETTEAYEAYHAGNSLHAIAYRIADAMLRARQPNPSTSPDKES